MVGDNTFREGAVSGFLLIFFSELGDKTFFIALLLALKQSQALVFAGTFGALAVMTVISVGARRQLWMAINRLFMLEGKLPCIRTTQELRTGAMCMEGGPGAVPAPAG